MNAEYVNAKGQVVTFDVPSENNEPPRTTRMSERSTCGKWIYEHVLALDYYDVERSVAIFSLIGSGRRQA